MHALPAHSCLKCSSTTLIGQTHNGLDMLSAAGDAQHDRASFPMQCVCEEERGQWLAEQLQDTVALASCISKTHSATGTPNLEWLWHAISGAAALDHLQVLAACQTAWRNASSTAPDLNCMEPPFGHGILLELASESMYATGERPFPAHMHMQYIIDEELVWNRIL